MCRLSIKTLSSWFRGTGNRSAAFLVAPLFLILTALALWSPSSSAHLNSAVPLEATFRVTLNGFRVSQPTWDNALETDGASDEIRLMTNTYMVNPRGILGNQRAFKSAVICDGKFRDPDGLTTVEPILGSRRGFKGGDGFPTASPWSLSPEALDGNFSDLPPSILFEGRLVQGGDAVAIIPSIWEMDGPQELRTMYNDQLSFLSSSLGRSVADILRGPRITDGNSALRGGATVGLGLMAESIFIEKGFLGMGDPKDRPIGLVRRGNRYVFVPKVLVLSFDAAEAIARTNGPALGVIKVAYDDDPDLQGQYVLFLQVTRVGN
jgi:hypothetical protein